jgi:hypothetical protein
MTPEVALPPCTLLTCQVTAVLVVPEMVAVNTATSLVATVPEAGEMVTPTWASTVSEKPPTNRIRAAVRARRIHLETLDDFFANVLIFIFSPCRRAPVVESGDSTFCYDWYYEYLRINSNYFDDKTQRFWACQGFSVRNAEMGAALVVTGGRGELFRSSP